MPNLPTSLDHWASSAFVSGITRGSQNSIPNVWRATLDRWADPPRCYASTLHAFEQVNNLYSKRLGHEMQAGQCDVHSSVLERTYLRPMKPGLVRKLILRESSLLSERPHSSAQSLL